MEVSTRRGEKRKWATKSRSGCKTCKKSHVKCDESKPYCGRCVRLNLACEGYQNFAEKRPISKLASRQQRRLLAREDSDTTFSDNESRLGTSCVVRHTNLTPSSIAVWLSVARTPYERVEERKGLQIWLEIMRYMGRSDVGLQCWTVHMPMLAWSYDGVRQIQTATALLLDSLRRCDDISTYRSVELLSLRHAKMAADATLNHILPLEARIMISVTLWMFNILIGRSLHAMDHAATAYQLAGQADLRCCSEPVIAKYVSSFVGELWHTFNENALVALPKPEQEEFMKQRIEYSHDILLHAMRTIQSLRKTLSEKLDSKLNTQYAHELLSSSEKGLGDVINGWHHKARFEDLDSRSSIIYPKIIGTYSPFKQILEYFDDYFEDHDERHLTKFHLQFRPCLDYFMWIAAGSGLEARQIAMSLWNVRWAISPRASAIAAN